MNTNHLQPEEESLNIDDGAADGRFPPNSLNYRRLNEWSPIVPGRTYCIRNETRPGRSRDVDECATSLEELFSHPQFMCTKDGEELFCHATSWSCCLRIAETCPKPGRGPQDLAPDGAFYLNPDYPDGYQWLHSKRGSFGGEHAMLLYKFKPEDLSRNGKVLDEQEWRDLVYGSNTVTNNYGWLKAPMNTNPLGSHDPGQQIRVCRRSDGELAMQFVIRSPQICRQLHKYLVGVIFYEKINPPSAPLNPERFDHRNDSSTSHKRSRSSAHSKTRGSKRSFRR